MQKSSKNSNFFKKDGHSRIPTLKLVYNSIQRFAKMYFIFFTM